MMLKSHKGTQLIFNKGIIMKKKLLALMLTASFAAYSDIGLKFNYMGQFVPPDQILQNRGLESYQDGFHNVALGHLKNSVEFGNDMSKYIISLMYFEKKDWINGYAWLKLLNNPVENSEEIAAKFDKNLTAQELLLVKQRHETLKSEYNDYTILQRREKWRRSLKFTGSHLRGIKALSNRNVLISAGGFAGRFGSNPNGLENLSLRVDNATIPKTLSYYLNEYLPANEIKMGKIKAKN